MEQVRKHQKMWLEHYAIEEGPKPHELSRIAQMAVSQNALHNCAFAICKFTAPLPQSAAEQIRWDRVSLDSQTLIMTLEHLTLIESHYWRVEGVLKNLSNVHCLRKRHRNDTKLMLFEKDMPLVAYYNTSSGAGWVGPALQETTARLYQGRVIKFTEYLNNPQQGLFFQAQIKA